jgi:murein DD-endopeptidase MepM/ murein hydrolase activator NlpD
MGSTRSTTRAGALLTGGLAALSLVGMAAASPAEAPEVGALPGLRPLERLGAALPAGRRSVDTPARPEGAVPARSVGDAVAGRSIARIEPVPAFPVEAAPDYGEHDARFGANRSGHMHEGQDVFAPAGTPLVAPLDGVAVEEGDDGGRGNYIALFSPSTRQTYVYLHMQRPSPLDPGDSVRSGERVGRVGCTGSCWGDHLHFEVRDGKGTTGRPRDPLPLLRRWHRG